MPARGPYLDDDEMEEMGYVSAEEGTGQDEYERRAFEDSRKGQGMHVGRKPRSEARIS